MNKTVTVDGVKVKVRARFPGRQRGKAPGRREAISSRETTSPPTNSTAGLLAAIQRINPIPRLMSQKAPPLDRRGSKPAAKVGGTKNPLTFRDMGIACGHYHHCSRPRKPCRRGQRAFGRLADGRVFFALGEYNLATSPKEWHMPQKLKDYRDIGTVVILIGSSARIRISATSISSC